MPRLLSLAERSGAVCFCRRSPFATGLLAAVGTFKAAPRGSRKAGWREELLVYQQRSSSPGRGCFPCPDYFFLCSYI